MDSSIVHIQNHYNDNTSYRRPSYWQWHDRFIKANTQCAWISLWKNFRDYYALTIERLALIVFHSLSNFNLRLLSPMVQQCTYQNRLHHDGYGQVKNYNEMIHNLSLQYQVDIFQYSNILRHKNIAKFHKNFGIINYW